MIYASNSSRTKKARKRHTLIHAHTVSTIYHIIYYLIINLSVRVLVPHKVRCKYHADINQANISNQAKSKTETIQKENQYKRKIK